MARGDYVLALKGNQETLHEAVIDYMDQHVENDFADVDVRQHTTRKRATAAKRRGPTSNCRPPKSCRGSTCGRG